MLKNFTRQQILFFGGALLLFVVVQLLMSFGVLNDFWTTIILLGGVMAIVSLGLNLIYGFNGQFSLGQWGFYALGAYASADITYRWVIMDSTLGLTVVLLGVLFAGAAIVVLQRWLSKIRGLDALSAFTVYLLAVVLAGLLAVFLGRLIDPTVSAIFHALPGAVSLQIIYFISILLAGAFAALVSFLFGLPVLTLGSDYFGIATLGLTIIVKVLLDNSDTMLGFEEMKGARGMVSIPKVTNWFWVFLFLFLIVVITRNLLQSSTGRAIVSVREDEIAAKAMGIDIANYKILTFVLGSLFAGIAGALYAHINGFLHPNTFNFIKSFDPMIIVVFGGMGSVTGTLGAAFAWALVLEGLLRLVLPQGFETWRFVVYPLLLLLMMLLKPDGLFGKFELPFLRHELPKLKSGLRKGANLAAAPASSNPEAALPGEPAGPSEVLK